MTQDHQNEERRPHGLFRGCRFGAPARQAARSLARHGLYDPAEEHDACGVGLVASIDGTPRREVVEAGIEALKAVWHRGAVDADGKTGDGAGIHVQIPQDFLPRARRAHRPRAGPGDRVGMVFLPRTDLRRAGALPGHRRARDPELRLHDLRLAPGAGQHRRDRREGQRHPARDRADHDRQQPRRDGQAVRGRPLRHPPAHRARCAAEAESIKDFYICSLSCRSIIYKGMFLAEQLTASIPTCSTSASSRTSRSSTSAIRPTPSRTGGWRSPSACSPTTARSTPQGQRQLDEGARVPHGQRGAVRRGDRGPEAGDPAGQLGFGGARRGLRADGPRRPRSAHGQDHADPRGLEPASATCRRPTRTSTPTATR